MGRMAIVRFAAVLFVTLFLIHNSGSAQSLTGGIHAYTWHVPPVPASNLTATILVNPEGDPSIHDPVRIAAKTKAMPAGRRVLRFQAWERYYKLLHHPLDKTKTASGTLTTYDSPWLDNATADMKTATEAWVQKFVAAGGQVDMLVFDYEENMSNWNLNAQWVAAIKADPRWATLSAKMEGYSIDKIFDTRNKDYLYWNDLQWGQIADALNKGVVEPFKARFPNIKASNYSHNGMTPENVAPELNGHRQFIRKIVGTHKSFPLYGWLHQVQNRLLDGSNPYGKTPFGAVRLLTNTARAMYRATPAPVMPWIGYKSWNTEGVVLYDNPYYEESVYHIALSGADGFLFWNSATHDPGATAADNKLVDSLITVLNNKLGTGTRVPLTVEEMPWDSQFIVTGMKASSGKTVWRVTTPVGVTRVDVWENGTKKTTLSIEPRSAGLWYESAAGVPVKFTAAGSVGEGGSTSGGDSGSTTNSIMLEPFSNAAWQKDQVTLVEGIADPFGGVGAVTAKAPSNDGALVYSAISVKPNTTYTFSVYWKMVSGPTSQTLRIYNGTMTASLFDADISYTSTWKRAQITFTTDASTTSIRPAIGGEYEWSALKVLQVYGAVLNEGASAAAYTNTNNPPLELRMEQFTDAAWMKDQVSLTNGAPDPFGGLHAMTASPSSNARLVYRSVPVKPNTDYTFTVYWKMTSGPATQSLRIYDDAATVTLKEAELPYSADWQRAQISFRTGADVTSIRPAIGGEWDWSASEELQIFGAMFNEGLHPVAYDATRTDAPEDPVGAEPTFALAQNFPNPFQASTTIEYEVPGATDVLLQVFDITGRLVQTLVQEYQPAGKYEVVFEGGDLASGTYICRLKAGAHTATRRMVRAG